MCSVFTHNRILHIFTCHYCVCLFVQSSPILCEPMDCSLQAPLSTGILQARITEWLPCLPPGDLPNPGIEPRSPALQADYLPTEPSGKPKNTGVGRLSLLLRIFPTQESNWCLLHCRWILYQLSSTSVKPVESVKQVRLVLFARLRNWDLGWVRGHIDRSCLVNSDS